MKLRREIIKLGAVCKVIAGQSPRGNAYNDKGLGVEFHQGKKAFGKDVIQPSGVWTTEITKMAEAGDILMSVRAPVGPTNFTDRSVCIGRGLAAIRCSELVLPQYILYALKNIESKIVGKDGAVFNSISKDMIEDLPVPKLPLSEQQRIVALLDSEFAKIDALKSNAEKNLQNAKDLFQSALRKELEPREGWQMKTIGEVFQVTDYVANGSFATLRENVKYLDTPDYAVLVRLADFTNSFDTSKFVYVNKHAYEFLSKSSLQGGDLIMSNVGSIGKVFKCPNLGMPMTLGPNSIVIKTPNNDFYYYYLMSSDFQKQLLGITTQVTLAKFNKTSFKTLEIPIPTLSDQQTIVARLDALSEKCKTLQANCEKTIALCDDLKQALLREAFNGEI